MRGISAWLRALAAVMCFSFAAASAYSQGPAKDFAIINPPQPTETGGGKIEVIEFFSYACPHCHTLEGPLNAWIKRKPADVEVRRVPVIFNDSWAPLARLYYSLEAMGLVEKLHAEVFRAMHEQKVRLQDPKVMADWIASKGVDRQKFTDTYNSFTVQSRAQRTNDITRRYNIEFTPALVINGRFMTGPSMTSPGNTVDYNRFFKVVDQLVANSRKPGGK